MIDWGYQVQLIGKPFLLTDGAIFYLDGDGNRTGSDRAVSIDYASIAVLNMQSMEFIVKILPASQIYQAYEKSGVFYKASQAPRIVEVLSIQSAIEHSDLPILNDCEDAVLMMSAIFPGKSITWQHRSKSPLVHQLCHKFSIETKGKIHISGAVPRRGWIQYEIYQEMSDENP